ncbi:lytic transglycosylase [Pseudomonas sp. o96-267]|uniref:lytic transglycosylase domain-containing protein n=1 Tax=Pseudomonas sp. o96-267 TaxID=2479853 RepID=UPI000F7B5810|nr:MULTISPECIES: lytic transglycosylase domain-containing protein [Pseudomonas]MDH0960913.1 lytic transglycosylase domain-containing protein [Pseudomonas chengduensis]MDV5863669.1 lytic transglycosylase domain-containing protein [Pseudomonas mendocina]RRV29959.1 lytic transglycosylase [Pseudomonas sp. o96-267]
MRNLILSIAMCSGLATTPAFAIGSASDEALTPLTPECLASAAERYELHPDILLAILIVEGGTVGQNNRGNANGSYDIGPFQLNTIHLPTLAKFNITETELRNDGCLNAAVAAWHLRRVLTPQVLSNVTDDESYLRALALYHSATPEYNEIYAGKLRAAFTYLYDNEAQ